MSRLRIKRSCTCCVLRDNQCSAKTVVVTWMKNMACSMNVDIREFSVDIANLPSRISHFLLPVDNAVCFIIL